MFHKILVCTDGSAAALEATRLGAVLAQHLGSEVLALNVFADFYADAAYLGAWSLTVDQDSLDRCAQAQQEAIEKCERPSFDRMSVSCRFLQERDHPVQGILRVAEREKVDLIVIGSRGLSGLKELFLGSVSNGVLHHAPCSVLIARGENTPCGIGEFKHILLASDGSETASKAATTAVYLAQAFAAPLTVLNVFEESPEVRHQPEDAVDADDMLTDSDQKDYAENLLDMVRQQTAGAAREVGISCSFHQERGHPGESIVRFAIEHNSDLIVMGSRGLGGFKEMLLGSVSNYVAHHAECPILVMRG